MKHPLFIKNFSSQFCYGLFLLLMAFPLWPEPVLSVESSPENFPTAIEQQEPQKMHSAMKTRPSITAGQTNAVITGNDNRALQAAVDYMASLGGGTVEIGEGEYLMHDALHLRPFVTVRGVKGKTILRKADGVSSPLALDGDFGEEQITVTNPAGFEPGYGVAIWDKNANGFHITVARITGCTENTFSINKPLNADCMVSGQAMAATIFPVVSGYDLEGVRVENLIIDGNKDHNLPLNGCRGGGIFLYRGFGTVIRDCLVKNYNGDGISFQQSNDVQVISCITEDNAELGLHPGSGSQRPAIHDCVTRHNGTDGLFLCWRVRFGVFTNNLSENNGRYGISIGHKDSDNLLNNNVIRSNKEDGVFFRNETVGMAAHRNRLENNIIENNGTGGEGAGIRVRGETRDLVFKNNLIRDTHPADAQTQKTGIQIEEEAGAITLENNAIEAKTQIDDRRGKK